MLHPGEAAHKRLLRRSEPDPELRAHLEDTLLCRGADHSGIRAHPPRGGLELVSADEDYSEFMRIILHVSREYGVGPGETGVSRADLRLAPADSGFSSPRG
ncbi:MAG: hypothetical protein ACLUEK_15150 [Oscillospiraceae bacterium]